jgi:hypothetical protein
VPDRGDQREDALQDADQDTVRGVAAVSFQVELTLEGLVDRFDGLTQRPSGDAGRPRGADGDARSDREDVSARRRDNRTNTDRSAG